MKIIRPFISALLASSYLLAQEATPSSSPVSSAPSATPKSTPDPSTPVALTPHQIIDKLSDAQLDQAIQNLRTNFLAPARTDDHEVRRATLEGLIERLSPGVTLTTDDAIKQKASGSPAFLAEILDARIGYVRVGILNKDTLAQLDAALATFKEKQLRAVILDLRGAPASTDYEMAAEFARRFCPRGKLLFSVQKPSAKQERMLTSSLEPSFSGVIVVLTDKNTSGGAEAIAAALRQNANAMIVGATTRGEAVEFSDTSLGNGRILRIAVSQVVIPDVGPIFPNGIKPDITAALSLESQARIFALSKEKGVSQFVFETERPHFNEAALVANTNPELAPDDAIRADERHILWDTVLQRAVDLVTAIGFYGDRTQQR